MTQSADRFGTTVADGYDERLEIVVTDCCVELGAFASTHELRGAGASEHVIELLARDWRPAARSPLHGISTSPCISRRAVR